ncbi:hypothetical protein NKH77_44505 [Streptomyces sp. M19]
MVIQVQLQRAPRAHDGPDQLGLHRRAARRHHPGLDDRGCWRTGPDSRPRCTPPWW